MKTIKVHISEINIGDTIMHNGVMQTVCKRVLSYSSFMGISLFGDTYNLGYKPVTKVLF